MTAWIAGMSERRPDLNISYDAVGSGAGREIFLTGGSYFAGSDTPMDATELRQGRERCFGGEVLELPLFISPIAVAYNLPGLGADHLRLSPQTLARVFTGEIERWNDPEIAEQNPDANLPDREIVPVNRSDESGTTENFTEYLHEAAGEAWPHEPSESWPFSGTQSGAQSSGVAQVLQTGEGTIGYVDAAQVSEDLGTVAVGVGEEYVPYSAEAAARVVDVSEPAEDASDLRLTLDLARDTDEAGVYPIVLVSYTLACSRYESRQDAENVRALLTYMSSAEGQQRVARPDVAGAAPISESMRERVRTAVDRIQAVED